MRQRIRSHLTYANVVATLALFLVIGGVGYAATGGNFILGHSNTASSKSTLSAPIGDKALTVTNNSTKAGATALGLNVASGHPPFTVNSGTKVPNLNADKLDGIDSSQLPAVQHGTAPQASGGTVIQWNALGARFYTSGANDDLVRIQNTRSSGNIDVLWGNSEANLGPNGFWTINVNSLTTFIVHDAAGTKSWLVACVSETGPRITCQGVAS